MKAKEIKQLSTADLSSKLEAERENYAKLKFNHSVSPVDSPIRIRSARRTIARMQTELRLREKQEKENKKQ